MNAAAKKRDKAQTSKIRIKFDRVLKRHIRRLLETSDSEPSPPYSMNMIACLLVLVEREKEMIVFPGSPVKTYTRETFLKDLDEIGIEPDDNVMVEIQEMAQSGYIFIGDDDEFRAREPATKFLSMLDAVFPSMQGLSLIAYILQSIDEVSTGRKEMMHAIRQFDETLLTRGESVSKKRVEALRRQRAAAARKKNDPAALKKRQAYLEKLKSLRARRAKQYADPAIVTTSGFNRDVEIRELFPKLPKAPQTATDTSTEVPPENPPLIDAAAQTPDTQTPEPPEAQTVLEPPPPPPVEPETPTMPTPAEETATESLSKEELIAQQIIAFEEDLAITCPVCKTGKIHADTTEKGKTYYHCRNDACSFVSWGKPYHMACPECKNPFLIDFEQKDGGIGLKCPRATCAFQHRDFDGHSLPGEKKEPGERKKVRKVAIRKKGGKKGGRRRVVRRKK